MTNFSDDPNYQAVLQAFKEYYSRYKELRLGNISGKRPYIKFVTDDNGYTAPVDEKLDQLKAVVKGNLRELEGFSMPQSGADDLSSLDKVLKEALKEIREDEIIDLGDQMLRTGPELGIVKEDAMAAFEHYKATMRDDRAILDLISERQKDFEKQHAAITLSDGLVSEGVPIEDVPGKVATIIQQGDDVLHGRLNVEDLFEEASPARLQYYNDLLRVERQLQTELGHRPVGEIPDINNLIVGMNARTKALDPYKLSLPGSFRSQAIDGASTAVSKDILTAKKQVVQRSDAGLLSVGVFLALILRRVFSDAKSSPNGPKNPGSML